MSNDELSRAIGRIEGTLCELRDRLEQNERQRDARLDNHGARLSKLERWQAWTIGAGVAAGAALSALWAVFTQVIHGR